MPPNARASSATVASERKKTVAITATIPSSSTPSWCAVAPPPPKKRPLGSFGKPRAGGEALLGEEGDHRDTEESADEVSG